MGILIGILVLFGLISTIISAYIFVSYRTYAMKRNIASISLYLTIWAAVFAIIYGVITTASLMSSYDSYLDARTYYDNLLAQYKGAITLYEDKAITLDMESAAKHALTDMRYQGYQEKMGGFVMDLRKSITKYNSTVIKKHLLKKNFFYGWYIIPPDPDMKTVDIISKN